MQSLLRLAGVAGLTALLLAGPAGAGPDDPWTVLEDSTVGFTAYQGSQPVKGQFTEFDAQIRFDPEALEQSTVGVDIMIDSVDTGDSSRDGTIRGADLFDAKQWPTARFEADSFRSLGENRYEAVGRLRMRDQTRDVTLPFTLEIGDHPDDPGLLQARAAGEISVSRLEFGVGQGEWSTTGTVGETVDIAIDIQATRPK